VGWVALFSLLAGLIYGAWNDGVSAWLLAGGLAALIAALAAGLVAMNRWNERRAPARAREPRATPVGMGIRCAR
jgi:O-antigen/teichoic acid export membrane protein